MPVGDTSSLLIPTQFFSGAGGPSLVAVIWQRFGPYHLARLRGAAGELEPHGWRVVGLEVAERDHYGWSIVRDPAVVQRTLFPSAVYSSLSSRQIKAQVRRALSVLQPSAVCINGWAVPEAVAAFQWCRAHRRRAVLMCESHRASRNPLKTWIKRRRLRLFHAALVGGRVHARYLRSLGFAASRIEIGYDVVDNDHFLPRIEPLVSPLPGLSAKRYIFANTRFVRRKGIDALLRAYARYRHLETRVQSGHRAWPLVISGSGEMEAAWKRLAADLGVAHEVFWTGFLRYDELPAYYRPAGLFVHPAREEPWGLVVNEAAAAGLPLIVGRNVGAACELLREGQNGFLVEPDDEEQFAMLLCRLTRMSDPERAAMGEASRRMARDFDPTRFGQALARCLSVPKPQEAFAPRF